MRHVEGASELEQAIGEGKPAVTDDPLLVAQAEAVDAVIEVTGTVELAAQVTLAAIEAGKHVVLMNAEVDGTLGPILKTYADRAGVVLTNADGDQPGVQMNLYRFVRGLGVTPVLCGNIKGLHDPYRNADDAGRVRRPLGPEPADGDLVRRRDEDLVRAGDRRERDRHACLPPRDAWPGGRGRNADRGSRQGALTSRLVRGSSTMSSARPQARASSCSARTTTRSSSTT